MKKGLLAVLLLSTSPGWAQDHPSYSSLWDAVAHAPSCAQTQYPDFIVITCQKPLEMWYFTKPNHPAHPGVIKRYFIQDAKGISAAEHGWSLGSDAAQPAFKTWLAQIQDEDRRAKELLQKMHGAKSPS